MALIAHWLVAVPGSNPWREQNKMNSLTYKQCTDEAFWFKMDDHHFVPCCYQKTTSQVKFPCMMKLCIVVLYVAVMYRESTFAVRTPASCARCTIARVCVQFDVIRQQSDTVLCKNQRIQAKNIQIFKKKLTKYLSKYYYHSDELTTSTSM